MYKYTNISFILYNKPYALKQGKTMKAESANDLRHKISEKLRGKHQFITDNDIVNLKFDICSHDVSWLKQFFGIH